MRFRNEYNIEQVMYLCVKCLVCFMYNQQLFFQCRLNGFELNVHYVSSPICLSD